MKTPSFQSRHAAAQSRGDFTPYRHPLPLTPARPEPQGIPLPALLALRCVQVLACILMGIAFVAGAIALRHFTR